MELPCWLNGKESACQCKRHGFNPWAKKMPWRRKWRPIPGFLPGKSQGQRSLAGYSPWGHKRVKHDSVTKQQPPPSLFTTLSCLKLFCLPVYCLCPPKQQAQLSPFLVSLIHPNCSFVLATTSSSFPAEIMQPGLFRVVRV